MLEWPSRTITVTRRRLPHWQTERGTYFVTFRLADALPSGIASRIRHRARAHPLADRLLDRGIGCCWFRNERMAKIVDDAFRFFDGARYFLHAWTIMPNHVHVAVRTVMTLSNIVQAWKGYTAREVNFALGRRGRLWQDESYDTLIHDQNDLNRVIDYIVRNPVKAGLADWPWTTVLRREFSF